VALKEGAIAYDFKWVVGAPAAWTGTDELPDANTRKFTLWSGGADGGKQKLFSLDLKRQPE
jgi:hypothetical protein